MSQKTQLIIVIGIAMAFFALGYASSLWIKIGPVKDDSYQAGWDAAKKNLIETGFTAPAGINGEVKNISGEIKEIGENKIILKTPPLEPLADESLNERIVIIDSVTKIYRLEEKSQKEYAAEVDAYNKNRKTIDSVNFPNMFKKIEIKLSDLKVGQIIRVISEKNIKELKEFTAVEINLNTSAAPIVKDNI